MAKPITRPEPNEYQDHPYQSRYIQTAFLYSHHSGDGNDALKVLRWQKGILEEIYKNLPKTGGNYRYADGKWTIKEVLGHMIDTERILNYRILAIARGEKQALPSFDEDAYLAAANFSERKLKDMWGEYHFLRENTIAMCKSFSEEMLQRKSIVNVGEISVRALIWLMAGHERHHLNVLQQKYHLSI